MRLIIGFLFALTVALFAVQNSTMVSVRVLAWMVETSLVLVIIGSAALGALSATLLGLPSAIRLRLKVREYEGKLKRMEAEVKELRDANAPDAAHTDNAPPDMAQQDMAKPDGIQVKGAGRDGTGT